MDYGTRGMDSPHVKSGLIEEYLPHFGSTLEGIAKGSHHLDIDMVNGAREAKNVAEQRLAQKYYGL